MLFQFLRDEDFQRFFPYLFIFEIQHTLRPYPTLRGQDLNKLECMLPEDAKNVNTFLIHVILNYRRILKLLYLRMLYATFCKKCCSGSGKKYKM